MKKIIPIAVTIFIAPLLMASLVWAYQFYGVFGGWLGIHNNSYTNDLIAFQFLGTAVTLVSFAIASTTLFDDSEEDEEIEDEE